VMKRTPTGLIIIESKERHVLVEAMKAYFIQIGERKLFFKTIQEIRMKHITDSIELDREAEYQKEAEAESGTLTGLLNYSIMRNMVIRLPSKNKIVIGEKVAEQSQYFPPEVEDRFYRSIPSPMDDAGLPLYEYAGNPVSELRSGSYQSGVKCAYWGEPKESHLVFPGEGKALVEKLIQEETEEAFRFVFKLKEVM